MRYSEGDLEKSDYFIDCGWYEYYDRIRKKKEYIEWHNANLKKQMNDAGK